MPVRWRDIAERVAGTVLDAVLPQTCCSCASWIPAGAGPLCDDCRAALEATAALPYCPRCARTAAPLSIHEQDCARCRSEQFWNVRGIVRVGEYGEEALRRLLLGLKFAGHDRQADLLGELLADALRGAPWFDEIEVLAPVPMHRLRRWQRPCDHAQALAESAARRLGLPVQRAAVRRVKYARSQIKTLSRAERFRNVKDCFGPARFSKVAGATVCIVDNLLVSGATIHEVSKVLRQSGAKRIYAAVAARAHLPGDPRAASPLLGDLGAAQGRDG
jgi:ComF family protein